MLVSDSQPENASRPMLVTLSGIVILASDEQPANALLPMLVTLSGMIILASDVQLENALTPILVTGKPSISKGIFTETTDSSQPEISIPLSCFIYVRSPYEKSPRL